MRVCPQCGAENPADVARCNECGEPLDVGTTGFDPLLTGADHDPEKEREAFERRFGIDVGDRTVQEYVQHLSEQDYSLTWWIGVIVLAESAGAVLFVTELIFGIGPAVDVTVAFPVLSLLLAVGVFADSRVVGQFRPRARIRWTYVLLSAIPLVGHVAALFYLVLRRLMRQQTEKHRRRLLDAGLDLAPAQ